MSSTVRQFAETKTALTKFQNISTPCYYNDEIVESLPLPLSCKNGVLEIELVDSDITNFVNNGDTPWTDNDYYTTSFGGVQVRMMSGPRLATELGDNFKTWLRNWAGVSSSAEVKVLANPVMIRVQSAGAGNDLDENEVFDGFSNSFSGEDFIGGDESNHYYSTWVFKTPLVVDIDNGYERPRLNTIFDLNIISPEFL